MPPKSKLHKEKGKLKAIPKPVLPSTSESSPSQPSTSDSHDSQFEVELVWCIQQLQSVLAAGKLNEKQTHENSKTLNSLMNNSTPIIKKRQLMRLAFGDYRAKMVIEEKKFSKINRKVVLSQGTPSKKSVFIKKAPFLSSEKDFKFNFKPESEESNEHIQELAKLNLNNQATEEIKNDIKFNSEQVSMEINSQTIEEPKIIIENSDLHNNTSFHFKPSDNVFRFNFTENTD